MSPLRQNSNTGVLLLQGPDHPGLVAAVAAFITDNGGNILHADQHRDPESGVFIQRVEWEMEKFRVPPQDMARAFAPVAEKGGMTWQFHHRAAPPAVAVLVSREGHCLLDLLARQELGELGGRIALVISNHEDMGKEARRFGVNFLHLPVEPVQEDKIARALAERKIDLVVLARYMRLVGPALVADYRGRMINIHHSFLPAFAGAKPYHQAFARGVKIIGATAHYVTDKLDEGPIIEQDIARVSHRDAVEDLQRKGRDLEKVVLARAVNLHLARRVMAVGNKTVVFD